VAAVLESDGADRETARTVARLCVAVSRGLLLDVLATGDDEEVDAAMRWFQQLVLDYLSRSDGSSAGSSAAQYS
jgi:hypothetical protein